MYKRQAHGYDVTVTELVGWEHSLKNELIIASKSAAKGSRPQQIARERAMVILHDAELEDARRLAWQIHTAGADALIIQDMGLLEMDLPPIQLHASTQTDNPNPAKVRFLEDACFSQVVLARELSLNEIINISSQSTVSLEYFVHGALCVAFSGQCYISHAHTGRSANRGECSQACRLPYTCLLYTSPSPRD